MRGLCVTHNIVQKLHISLLIFVAKMEINLRSALDTMLKSMKRRMIAYITYIKTLEAPEPWPERASDQIFGVARAQTKEQQTRRGRSLEKS